MDTKRSGSIWQITSDETTLLFEVIIISKFWHCENEYISLFLTEYDFWREWQFPYWISEFVDKAQIPHNFLL